MAAPRLQGLAPITDADTRLIVLGSFPSAASLTAGQYYAHPRNQFWPLASVIWAVDLVAMPMPLRLAHLLSRRVGLWDAHAECSRVGSLDSAIADAVPNDLSLLLQRSPRLRAIAHHGGESARFMRHSRALGLDAFQLPSTSPAHASWSFERKLDVWRDAFQREGLA